VAFPPHIGHKVMTRSL